VANYLRMNKFTVHYKAGKRHIKAKERDELLIAGEIEPINALEYRYIAKPRILTSFQALANLNLKPQRPVHRYLGLSCIFELAGKRRTEREETPEGLAIRLQTA
jgi:hypothetical protein